VADQPTVVVQIGGAVATPGVYTLPGGARLQDAIVAAGGLASDANPSSLNLAARVGDGESITVESLGRATEPPAPAGGELAVVNINTATLDELDSLPGIGPVIGERIIAYREEHGPFVTIDGLIEVEGISANLLERLRPRITVDE
jgi:competence protein ComEA